MVSGRLGEICLAFARIFVNRPSFAILDEATSALDLKNEDNLYEQLQSTNTTFISVGHRESLFQYHQWVLELSHHSSWELMTVEDYQHQKAKQISPNLPETNQAIHQKTSTKSLEKKAISPPTEVEIEPEVIEENSSFSHQEMKKLTNYALSTIRNKASRGQSITGKDGFTYAYNKDPSVLKWVRT